MERLLMRAALTGEKLEMIYESKSRRISQRIIKVLSYTETSVRAYCYLKNHYRTFNKENILAVFPAGKKCG